MGRWAQRQRRGSSPGPTSDVLATVTIVSVQGTGTEWIITFDAPISCNVGLGDTNFAASDATTSTCTGAAGSACSVTDDSSLGYVSGLPWNLFAQPNWLNNPIAGPQAGTTV